MTTTDTMPVRTADTMMGLEENHWHEVVLELEPTPTWHAPVITRLGSSRATPQEATWLRLVTRLAALERVAVAATQLLGWLDNVAGGEPRTNDIRQLRETQVDNWRQLLREELAALDSEEVTQ